MNSNDDENKPTEQDDRPTEQDDRPIVHKWKPCDGFCWDCERRTWCWASRTGEQYEFGN